MIFHVVIQDASYVLQREKRYLGFYFLIVFFSKGVPEKYFSSFRAFRNANHALQARKTDSSEFLRDASVAAYICMYVLYLYYSQEGANEMLVFAVWALFTTISVRKGPRCLLIGLEPRGGGGELVTMMGGSQ